MLINAPNQESSQLSKESRDKIYTRTCFTLQSCWEKGKKVET